MRFSSLKEIIDAIALVIAQDKAAIIAIDGFSGAGKTTIALKIAKSLGIQCLHIDKFINPGQGNILKSIRYNELLLSMDGRALILEGVCVLYVLKSIGVPPNLIIYVNSEKDSESIFHAISDVEFSKYSIEYLPRMKAHFIYEWKNDRESEITMNADRIAIDIAYIQAKTKISITMAIGGVIVAIVGLFVLLYGVSGSDKAVIKADSFDISISGLGGIIMLTSIAWAYFSYRAIPKYSHHHETSKIFDQNTNVTSWHERMSSTEIVISPYREKYLKIKDGEK